MNRSAPATRLLSALRIKTSACCAGSTRGHSGRRRRRISGPAGRAAASGRIPNKPNWDNRFNTGNRPNTENHPNMANRTNIGNNVNVNNRTNNIVRPTHNDWNHGDGTTEIGSATGTTRGTIGRWAGGRPATGPARPPPRFPGPGDTGGTTTPTARVRSSSAARPSITRGRSWWHRRPRAAVPGGSDRRGTGDAVVRCGGQCLHEAYKAALAKVDQAIASVQRHLLHEFRGLTLFALGRYKEAAAADYAVLSAGPGWDWTTLSGL